MRFLRRDGATRGDAGTSLAELLVVMAVSSVLLIAVGTTFANSLRLTKAVNSRTGATADARLAIDTAARRLRVAVRPTAGEDPMIVSGGATSVRFYASIARAGTTTSVLPTLIDYTIDATNSCFRESQTPAKATTVSGVTTYTWPASGTKSRCLVFGNVDANGTGVFTFYTSADASTPVALVNGQLPAGVLDSVRSVGLAMAVRERPGSNAKPTQVQSRVALVNRTAED